MQVWTLPQPTGNNAKGALYNPDASSLSALAAEPNFFTTAVLTMSFIPDPIFDITSPFVRMQNVGLDGEGSLKMTPVPEPSTLLMLGSGLLGLGFLGRKRYKK
jgi:hypothetical protein